MQRNPLFLIQNVIKVPFSLEQIALVLGYVVTAQCTGDNEEKIQNMLKLRHEDWKGAFLPACLESDSFW
jgi:hypothetical protein